ncbi:MAG: protein kinase [Oscillospiraceae bacterium]|nr:protein kinase [Oscillospiraceae bacterium]
MSKLGQYELAGEFSNQNGGYCVWCFAKKDGEDYFIKQFLSPKYPANDTESSPQRIEKKKRRCQKFEEQKTAIYRSVNENSDGNAVRIDDFFRVESMYYIAMRRVDTLDWQIEDICGQPELLKRRLCAIIAHAVAGLHRGRVVHADLKHSNILFTRTRRGAVTAKIIDFDSGFTEMDPPGEGEEIVGDPVYYSPEACISTMGQPMELTCKMDIFSLGVLFHQYFTGELPGFDSESYGSVGQAAASGGAVELSADLPTDVAEMIGQMLSRDYVDRPSADEVYQILMAPLCGPQSVGNSTTRTEDTNGRSFGIWNLPEFGPPPIEESTVSGNPFHLAGDL